MGKKEDQAPQVVEDPGFVHGGTPKSAEQQEAETPKQPDINNPKDGNKTYADLNG